MPRIDYENIIGTRYGRLTITEYSHTRYVEKGKKKYKYTYYKCKCDCGNEKVVCLQNLRHGDVKSCGCLQKEIDEYAIIIPTSALRDEGTSYHYAPAEDETIINPEMIDVLEKAMIEKKLHYKKGKTWTTDAIFRETKKKVDDRVKQGAIVVDMECSALNVLAEFRGVNFGQFFYAADNLGGEEYDVRTLVTNNKDEIAQKKIIALALDCGVAIDKKFDD